MMGSTAPRSNMYQSALDNDVRDRGLGGTQYQAPGSDLDPLGVGWYASQLWDVPTQFGGGSSEQGWTPPWGGNMNSFDEWFGGEYEDWLEGNNSGLLTGLGDIYGYFESLAAGDVPSYADWTNYYQGTTPGGGSNYMEQGGSGGNIGGAGDLSGGSTFSGLGYGNYGPGFGGFTWNDPPWPSMSLNKNR